MPPPNSPGQMSDQQVHLQEVASNLAKAYAQTLPVQATVDPTGQSAESQARMAAIWHAHLTYYNWLASDAENPKDFPPLAFPAPVVVPPAVPPVVPTP